MKNNWQTKKLGEVCDVFEDGDWVEKKDQSLNGIRLIQTGNVGNGVFKDRIEKARYISEKTFNRLKCTEILPGDCLISRLPDPVGRACIIPNTVDKMITAVDCTIIRFRKKIIRPEWFINFSLSRIYQDQINREVGGATRQRISRKNLYQIGIPIPSPMEQNRIIKILDETFEKVEKAKENATKNIKNSKELFKSYSQSIFVNPRKNWEIKKLGEICDFVRGPFGGSLTKSMFKKEGYVVYEQQHAINNQFLKVRYFIDEKKFNEMKRFELKPGDLIMSCSGTMGRIAIAPDNLKKGIINQALLKLSPRDNLLNLFLKNWMESGAFQNDFKIYTKGAAIKNVVSVKILKEIKIPVPELQEQKAIIAKLTSFYLKTKKLEAIYKQKLIDLEELKKSILKKAFSGKL